MNEQQQLKHEAAVQRAALTKAMRAAELRQRRLIAAAPDLLDALDNLMAKLELFSGCNPHDMNGEYPWPEFDAARAAIAKAEGAAELRQRRLIAAAPDLLEALYSAEEQLELTGVDSDALKFVRAAIAKAEGTS